MANYKTKSKSKTFQKCTDEIHQIIKYIEQHVEVHDATLGDVLIDTIQPDFFYPLSHKYVITVTRIEE